MNMATRAAVFNFQSNYLYRSTALFHSTSVLEQKKRNYWRPGKRSHRLRGKQEFLRNLNAYADYILQGGRYEFDENKDDSTFNKGPSWFRKHHSRGRNDWHGHRGPQNPRKRPFEFCEDEEVEDIIRSAFGGGRFFHWSFIEDETPGQRRSFRQSYSNRSSWSWKFHVDDEDYDSSSESDGYEEISSELVSDRLTLGLTASGPITLEDVKNAYRACALKWHPDRHNGPSKRLAEEKFKLCSSAYQSLCDKLALKLN